MMRKRQPKAPSENCFTIPERPSAQAMLNTIRIHRHSAITLMAIAISIAAILIAMAFSPSGAYAAENTMAPGSTIQTGSSTVGTQSSSTKTKKPAKVKKLKVKVTKKSKVKLSWKKVKGAKGYQIRFADNKAMKNAKLVKSKKNKKTLGVVMPGKTYIQVRPTRSPRASSSTANGRRRRP